MDTFLYLDDADVEHTIRVLGHRVLVLKCKVNQSRYLVAEPEKNQEDGGLDDLMLESMLRKDRIGNNICEVLALGSKCGKRRSKAEAKRFGYDREMVNPIKVGDFVALPEKAENLYRGMCGSDDLVMIDENEIICYYVPEGGDE